MEPGEIKIEEVLKKWERYHPPPERKEVDEKPWYQQPLVEYPNQRRSCRKRILKTSNQDFVNESHYMQRKFRVIPPVLTMDIQDYQISQCVKCQSALQYFPLLSKDNINSQSLSLFDYIAAKNSLKWHGTRFFLSVLYAACYQSKDQLLLKQLNHKEHPTLFVHSSPGFFTSLCMYIYCATFGQVPYTVIKDEDVSSPFLKYLMTKARFIFIKKGIDGDGNKSIAEMIVQLLNSNNHVLMGFEESEQSSSLPDRLFPAVLNIIRKDEKLLKRILLQPMTLAIETGSTLFTKSSLFGALQEWLYFPKSCKGLAQFNISRSVKLQSLMTLAANLNEQESCDEENNLIMRHISFNLLETGAVLPTNLVSFLLITKYRYSQVCLEDLNDSVEWLLNQLHGVGRFIGFSGTPVDVTRHALDILINDGMVEIDKETKMISPKTCSSIHLQILFENAKKIIHVFMIKAILSSSILACVGGRLELRQGSGYNVRCNGDKLLEKAEYLAEMFSFLFDYCCPFNKVTPDLVDSLEKLVTMDILKTCSDTYESQSHQKLVQSVAIDSVWDGDEDEDELMQGESEVYYDVSVEDDIVELLYFFNSCVLPFVEVTYTVIALIKEYKEGQEFSVEMLKKILAIRFEDGKFHYGEMVTQNFISRILDYLYEKEVIDEHGDDIFVLSAYSLGSGILEDILGEIALFR